MNDFEYSHKKYGTVSVSITEKFNEDTEKKRLMFGLFTLKIMKRFMYV